MWVRTSDSRTDLHIYPHGRFIGTARRGKMVFSGRGTCHMSFKAGDTVVYPHHGAARIEAVETRTIKGEDRTYLVLKVDKGDLTVRVPADNAELVGVRDVVGEEGRALWWASKGWSGCARCSVRRTPRSPRTGRGGTRPTWKSSPPAT